jgi:hypothetical protein
LMLSKFFTSGRPFRPHFGRGGTAFHAARRMASSASGGSPNFTMQFCRRCVHRGSNDPDKENFQSNRQSDFWEEISAILSEDE